MRKLSLREIKPQPCSHSKKVVGPGFNNRFTGSQACGRSTVYHVASSQENLGKRIKIRMIAVTTVVSMYWGSIIRSHLLVIYWVASARYSASALPIEAHGEFFKGQGLSPPSTALSTNDSEWLNGDGIIWAGIYRKSRSLIDDEEETSHLRDKDP